MQVNIILETDGDSKFQISSSEIDGICLIEIREGNRELYSNVSIEDLKLALRKLTTK